MKNRVNAEFPSSSTFNYSLIFVLTMSNKKILKIVVNFHPKVVFYFFGILAIENSPPVLLKNWST